MLAGRNLVNARALCWKNSSERTCPPPAGKALGAAASADGDVKVGAEVTEKFAEITDGGDTVRAGATATAFGIAQGGDDGLRRLQKLGRRQQ